MGTRTSTGTPGGLVPNPYGTALVVFGKNKKIKIFCFYAEKLLKPFASKSRCVAPLDAAMFRALLKASRGVAMMLS